MGERQRNAIGPNRGTLIYVCGMVLGIAAIVFGIMMLGNRDVAATPQDVRRELTAAALTNGSRRPDTADQFVGPLRLAAVRVDTATGDLIDVTIDSGAMMIGAARARIAVDAANDTFSLILSDVSFTRVPEGDANITATIDPASETSFIHHLDQHVIGPTPWGMPIDDGGSRGGVSSPSPTGPPSRIATPGESTDTGRPPRHVQQETDTSWIRGRD